MKRPSYRYIALIVVAVIVLGLVLWTIFSPPVLQVQSESDLSNSIFSSAITVSTYHFSDSSGSYTFSFGFDVPANVTQGAHTRIGVYAALLAENITFPLTRGVALSLDSATLSIDNQPDPGVTVSSKTSSSVDVFYLENPDTSLPSGNHTILVRLIFYTVDVNYIGNTQGSLNIVTFEGNFSISIPPV